jgi:hypothetical protein
VPDLSKRSTAGEARVTIATRITALERRANPTVTVGPYGPVSKPPFDYAAFEQVFAELVTDQELLGAEPGNPREGVDEPT